jgi:hypothetical protein
MSAAAIEAGKAWVELRIKDLTNKDLQKVQDRFLRWGQRLTAVGAAVAAGSTAIVAGLVAAAMQFNSMGSQALDMATSAGMAVEEFSALGYAAKQSGATVEQLASGMNALNRFTVQVARGSKSAEQTLSALSITASDFLAASPAERLGMIADGLTGISDQGLKAGLAMKILGRSGSNLLPMLAGGAAGLEALTERARRLGLVITEEEAAKAHRLGDAWDDLRMVWDAIVFKTGAALADTLTGIFLATVEVGAQIGQFIQHNQGLVVAFTALTIAAGIAGGAAVALGFTLIFLGSIASALTAILGGLSTALTVLGAVMTFLAGPVGIVLLVVNLLAAALIGLAVLWLTNTESGQQFASELGAAFTMLGSIASRTFAGIWDSLQAGNWQLAGRVAAAGLLAAFQTGDTLLRTMWEDFKLWLISLFADLGVAIASGLIASLEQALAVVNQAREALGLEAIDGGFLQAGRGIAQNVGAGVKGIAKAGRDANVAEAEAALRLANQGLDLAVAEAKRAREQAAAESGARSRRQFPAPPELSETVRGGESATGAFNAAVKGLLGRSAESVQERIARNTDAMNDWLADIAKNTEDGMGVTVAP